MFLAHERKLIQLAEQMRLPLALRQQHGHRRRRRACCDGASALISRGHDEYWTPPERANVTAARDAGVNVAFLGANCDVPAHPAGRQQRWGRTGWSSATRPATTQDPHVRQGQRAGHQRLAGAAAPRPRVVDHRDAVRVQPGRRRPTSWPARTPGCSRGTGVRRGTRFPGLVGIEYDRVNPGYPVRAADRGPVALAADLPRASTATRDSAYYTHRGGAGVFNAGTMRWVQVASAATIGYGIDQRDRAASSAR